LSFWTLPPTSLDTLQPVATSSASVTHRDTERDLARGRWWRLREPDIRDYEECE
jgi:hypothetical protein